VNVGGRTDPLILHFYACRSPRGPGDLPEALRMLLAQRAGRLRLRPTANLVISIHRSLRAGSSQANPHHATTGDQQRLAGSSTAAL
jgi:hypothetical protein